MPNYIFSTITAAQALAITAADGLGFDVGTGNTTTVLFSAPDRITIIAGGRTVVFGLGVAGAAKSYADGSTLYIGTPGNDFPFSPVNANNGLYGGGGDDFLPGAGGSADLLQGNQGNDKLYGNGGSDVIYGGQGDDLISVGLDGLGGFGQGNLGNDIILGSLDGADTLLGGQGDDLINAPAVRQEAPLLLVPTTFAASFGGDFLNGNLGNDMLFGGIGNDRIFGEDGNDYMRDFGGGNLLDGGEGADSIVAVSASSANTVFGGAGNDVMLLGGSNTVDAGAGDDTVLFFSSATPATILLMLGDGNDDCDIGSDPRGPADRYTVDGGAGNDLINTSDGADSVQGGAGNDTIDGWGGADTVAGGAGADTFEFFLGEAMTSFATLDQIVDWSSEDRLFFAGEDIDKPIGPATAANYVTGTSASYDAALAFANAQIAGGSIRYVSVAVGGDVYVFSDTAANGITADSAVRLVGRSLADIGSANFTGIGA